MGIKVAELFAEIGVVTDEQKIKDFINVLNEGKNFLLTMGTMALGTSLSFGAMFDKALSTSIALTHFTQTTGLSAEKLQEWQHVGEKVGLTADEVTASVEALNKQLALIRIGQGNIAPFQMLGVNPYQNAWQVLEQLRKIVNQATPSQIQTIAAQLEAMGLHSFVPLLKLTNAEFEKMARRDAIITDRQRDSLMRFNAVLRDTGELLTKVFADISVEFAPNLEEMFERINRFLVTRRKDFVTAVKNIGSVVKLITSDFVGAFSMIDKIVEKLGGWSNAVTALGVAFVFLNRAIGPWLLLVDALALINKIISDKGTWKEKLGKFMRGEYGGIISVIPRAGFKTGLWLNEQLNNNPALQSALQGTFFPLRSEAPSIGLQKLELNPMLPQTYSILQNIYSSADAREVANISAREIGRVINKSSKQIPNVR